MFNIKTLIYTTTLSVVITSLSAATQAATRNDHEGFPHLDGAVQFPQTRARLVRHTLRVHIPAEEPVPIITVNVPDGLKVRNDIEIFDQSHQRIDAKISVQDKTITIALPQPITSETHLNIDLNRVFIVGVSNAWIYPVSVQLSTSTLNLPIGVAQIRIY